MAKPARKVTQSLLENTLSPAGKEWLASCALEGIYPDDDTLEDLLLLTSGKMSADEFTAYVINKHHVANAE